MQRQKKQAIINYITAILYSPEITKPENKYVETLAKKHLIIPTLFMALILLPGAIMRKGLSFCIICICFTIVVCVYHLCLGKWLKNKLMNNKREAILIYRIIATIPTIICISMLLLYGIILIDGEISEVVTAAMIITAIVIITIPISLFSARNCIKNRNGDINQNKKFYQSPPAYVTVLISTFFVHALTNNGRIFVVTAFLCIINAYTIYEYVVPDIVRLHLVKKYSLEDWIPLIFEIMD